MLVSGVATKNVEITHGGRSGRSVGRSRKRGSDLYSSNLELFFLLHENFTMAEYVHQNLEGMLPELEEMERMGVFSSEEIR